MPSEAVRHVWKDVEKVLKKSVATAQGKSETIDVLAGILTDIYVLWVVMDDDDSIVAAFTTRLLVYPQRKALALDFVGGTRMNEWNDQLIDTMRKYA